MKPAAVAATTKAPRALCVAVLGAESTGKTTLASGLALALRARLATPRAHSGEPAGAGKTARPAGLRTAWVPEVLRQWCDEHGRTPQAHEQAAILLAQHAHIDAAARTHDVVVCDTTGLMTAVYSELIFGDCSLHTLAVSLHRRMAFSLLTALDLPWVADGHQRDGPQVQGPVDHAIRALLVQHALPFAVIGGSGPVRLQQGLAALGPALRLHAAPEVAAAAGLFTRLQSGCVVAGDPWRCECCGDAPYERALRRLAAVTAPPNCPAPGCPPG